MRKLHPEISQNQPQNGSFRTKHWYCREMLSIWKKKASGWAKTRARVSRPLIWNPNVWYPYRNEIKWHPRLGFLLISRSILLFKPETFWTWQILRPVVSRRKHVPSVRALVRWATGKRLTNRLPKLSLITLSPPLNSGILGLRMGPYVPTPRFFSLGTQGEWFIRFLTWGNTLFLKKRFHGGREIRTHDQRPMVLPTASHCSPLGHWQKVNQSPTQLGLITWPVVAGLPE